MKRILIILSTAMELAWVPASADIINVPGDYPTIQQGIDACGIYDTVMVADGVYHENLDISLPISLIGRSRDNTIIDGSGSGDVVFIDAGGVHVTNFAIRNSGSGEEDAGIEISFVDSCSVELCRFEENYSGLCLYGSRFNEISRSIFMSNENGIHFRESYPGPIIDNLANTIRNNIIENNHSYGVYFAHTGGTYHHGNLITGNRIAFNVIGVSSIVSQENDFAYNEISGNSGYGISHAMCMGGGDLNRFHHNNFLSNNNNSIQAGDVGGGIDYWYLIDGGHGNHWSDYSGSDQNGDGVGDSPYYIDGGESQDIYPLMAPLVSIIEGYVSDGLEPIEGVHVSAADTGIDDYTDSGGAFSLPGLGAGMFDISFSHPQYEDLVLIGVPATLDQSSELNVVMDVMVGTDKGDNSIPAKIALFQNYPNPFNALTTIEYSLPNSSPVTIDIFDLLGRKIVTLKSENQDAGYHRATWNADEFSSGIYMYRLTAGDYTESKRMLLLK